jgi:hypothetical protein
MPEEFKAGCARPTGGPVGEPEVKGTGETTETGTGSCGKGLGDLEDVHGFRLMAVNQS